MSRHSARASKVAAHYVDKTVDYEALMVARNAPRWLQMLVKHGYVPAHA